MHTTAVKNFKQICSITYGLDPNELPLLERSIGHDELSQKKETYEEILFTNTDYITNFLEKVKHLPFLLAITDSNGTVLKTFTTNEESTSILEGVQYNFKNAGINSISLALHDKKPVQILGNEHFHFPLYNKACMSVPFYVSSNSIGTLSMMTDLDYMDSDIHKMMVSTAKDAEKIAITSDYYKTYYYDILGFLTYLTKDKEIGKDLCQQTFISVYKGVDSFKKESSPKSWIYKIAYNAFVTWYRKDKKYQTQPLDNLTEQMTQNEYKEPFLAAYEKWFFSEIRHHMLHLSEDQQTVLTLREFHELSYYEIAKHTGWSISKVKTTLYRARMNLGDRLDRTYL